MKAPRSSRSLPRGACALLVTMAALAGCGQRGPLALPGDARPIEPAPAPASPSAEPESQDDERANER